MKQMKFANPAPLGLFGFAVTTWILSMINAGWYPITGLGMVLALAFAFGGTAQFAAGLLEFPRGNTFGFVAFCAYGAFWWSFALFVGFYHTGVPAGIVGWYLAAWGTFTFAMWLGTFSANRTVGSVFCLLWITFALLAAGEFTGVADLRMLGGYFGLATALAAFYLAAAEVLSETFGHDVLPIGRLGPAPGARQISDLARATA